MMIRLVRSSCITEEISEWGLTPISMAIAKFRNGLRSRRERTPGNASRFFESEHVDSHFIRSFIRHDSLVFLGR